MDGESPEVTERVAPLAKDNKPAFPENRDSTAPVLEYLQDERHF